MRRALVALLAVGACNTIESHRRSTAPLNASDEFPCDLYRDTPQVKAVPRNGRCLVDTNITYDFTVIVHVPESSFYAAGHTFVLSCPTASCTDFEVAGASGERRAKLPVLGAVIGSYTVKKDVASAVLDPFTLEGDATSIPVRAVYIPLGRVNGADYDPALPLDVLFASSRVDETQTLAYARSLPAGRWRRVFEPEPPWAEFFPPVIGAYEVKRAGDQVDTVDIGVNLNLDDVGGASRNARVTRSEGLDGWTVFLRDKSSGRRVSALKTLCTKEDAECIKPEQQNCCVKNRTEGRKRLDTIGLGKSLTDAKVEAVIAPPQGWIGVPTYVAEELLGTEIKLDYPDLRPPIALEGIVAASADAGVFLAVASRVTLERDTSDPAEAYPFLRYATTVSTDDRGRFATVIPPGRYRVTVAPLEGTHFAAFRQVVEIEDSRPITLSPPRRTLVRGTALLGDGRPAARAEVFALADPQADATAQPVPRPARTGVGEDGTFSFELDQGQYVITVVPEAGTGFPRVVTRAVIPADQTDVGVVRIPPPTRLGLQIVDPTTVARPIPLANVRIFAAPAGGGPLLEIGSGLTNADGRVEILLAQQPE